MLPFMAAFAATLIAEMGDKTQLATLTLSSRMSPRGVFTGAITALALVTGLGVALGGAVAELVPPYAIALAGGAFALRRFHENVKPARGRVNRLGSSGENTGEASHPP